MKVEFEKHSLLKSHIERMANTGSVGNTHDWDHFLWCLNTALSDSRRALNGEIFLCDSLRAERDALLAEREQLLAQEPTLMSNYGVGGENVHVSGVLYSSSASTFSAENGYTFDTPTSVKITDAQWSASMEMDAALKAANLGIRGATIASTLVE